MPTAGAEAIERYLSHDTPGRLMRSLKAYLADRHFDGTGVYGRHLSLGDLIAAFLKKLLGAAARSLGPIPSRVVVGRPVHFSIERSEAANELALGRLRAGRSGERLRRSHLRVRTGRRSLQLRADGPA